MLVVYLRSDCASYSIVGAHLLPADQYCGGNPLRLLLCPDRLFFGPYRTDRQTCDAHVVTHNNSFKPKPLRGSA